MATRSVSRARKAQSPSRAKSRRPVPRAVQEELREQLGGDFISARAAVYSAVLALETKGVYTHIATSLRMHVLRSLERIEKAATGRDVFP
jgi:hypothetical protein